jgi:hypothetical protein
MGMAITENTINVDMIQCFCSDEVLQAEDDSYIYTDWLFCYILCLHNL